MLSPSARRPIALAAATLMVKGASWPLITTAPPARASETRRLLEQTPPPRRRPTPPSRSRSCPLTRWTPLTDNPRTHTSRGIDFLKASLGRVGAARSGVIDEARTILAGNGMQDAATQVGYREAVVVTTDGTRPVFVRRRPPAQSRRTPVVLDDGHPGRSRRSEGALSRPPRD